VAVGVDADRDQRVDVDDAAAFSGRPDGSWMR
jgi:hypothetical protein